MTEQILDSDQLSKSEKDQPLMDKVVARVSDYYSDNYPDERVDLVKLEPNPDNVEIIVSSCLDTKDLSEISQITESEILRVCDSLGIKPSNLPRTILVITDSDSEEGSPFIATCWTTDNHPTILLSSFRLKLDPSNNDLLIRHEFCHYIDEALGENGKDFIELISETLAQKIKKLFPGLDQNDNLSDIVSELQLNHPAADELQGMVGERSILKRKPFVGHARANISEFFTSIMNAAFDDEFQDSLAQFPQETRNKYIEIYSLVMELVQERAHEVFKV